MKKQLSAIGILMFSASLMGQTSTKIFVSDIDNFWIAYDSVQTTRDSTKQLEFIKTLYLNKASSGLKYFMLVRQHSAKRHLNNILKNPRFWVSLRPHTVQIKSYTKDIENVMQRFAKLYLAFKQPDVYFTIGCLNSGGTTGADKILIGSEIAASDSTVDASELGHWLQGVFKTNQNVVYLVAHEVGHTQQKPADGGSNGNLLGYCILEGSCDFIAELLLQKPITTPYMIYGKANERSLWQAFEKEMKEKEVKNWLYNGSDAPNGNADLGYFMGYSICKSFYENATNKEQALKTIIGLDYKKDSILKFLEESKYPDKWK